MNTDQACLAGFHCYEISGTQPDICIYCLKKNEAMWQHPLFRVTSGGAGNPDDVRKEIER
jgi:hypothetical protein